MQRREDTVVAPLAAGNDAKSRAKWAESSTEQNDPLAGPPTARAPGPAPTRAQPNPAQPVQRAAPPPPAPRGAAPPPAQRAAPAPPAPRGPLPTAYPAVESAYLAPAPSPFLHASTNISTGSGQRRVEYVEPTNQTVVPQSGKVIVMFGCRGGAGATTLTVNAAATLVRQGKRVCVVDLDLQLGDVFVALDLEPTTSLAGLAREAGTIDAAALRRRLAQHASGIFALSQTGRVDDVDPQLAERMPALLSTLCEHFDVVLVDGVRDFSDHALATLDMADQVMLVVTQDVPAVRRAFRVTQLFRRLGYSDRKVRLILNRCTKDPQVPDEEIERALVLPIASRVCNDYVRMSTALNDGALLGEVARGSAIANDIENLARLVADVEVPTATAPVEHPGFFARLFSRRK